MKNLTGTFATVLRATVLVPPFPSLFVCTVLYKVLEVVGEELLVQTGKHSDGNCG